MIQAITATVTEGPQSTASPEPDEVRLNEMVRAALVSLLFDQGPLMIFGNVVTGTAMVVILYGRVATLPLAAWAVALMVWILARGFLMHQYARQRSAPEKVQRFGWATALFSTGFGTLWGIAALLFMQGGSGAGSEGGEHWMVVLFPVVIMGLNAVGTVSLASFPVASLGFALSSNLLLIVALLRSDNEVAAPLIAMVLISLASNLKNIRTLFRILEQLLRLRFENQYLRQRFEHKSRRLETTLDNIDQGLALLDRQGRLLMWNARLLTLMGGGARVAEHTPFEQLSACLQLDAEPDGQPDGRGSLWRRDDGACLEIRETDIGNGESVMTCSDVTTLKRHQQAQAQARRQAEQANVAKTRFLAAASHDLRQPVQALALVYQLLEERARGGDLQPLVEQMGQGIETLDGLLGNLLHISKLEAGLETPEQGMVDLGGLFEQLAAEFSLVARQHNDRLRFRPSTEWVLSDRYMLARILSNLIANAIKYTRNGRVLVAARRQRDHLRIGVYDNGPGIPVAYQTRIFEEFQQLHNPQRDRSQGLGLGLAIVKRTADLLGHHIEVASRVGRGSCFAVWVPLAQRSAVAEPQRPEQPLVKDGMPDRSLAGLRLWVIDDDPIVREALTALLLHWGCRVDSAEDLAAALALEASGVVPDMLLLDYRLPGGITGLDVACQLFECLGHPIPSVVLTGDTAPERLREADAGGFPLLHKPVLPQVLRDTLVELLGITARE